MERRDHDAEAERSRNRKDRFVDMMVAVNLILAGAAAGIALCKLCPPFWHWLNSGWMESPWIPKAMVAAGGLCISVALCIGEDK